MWLSSVVVCTSLTVFDTFLFLFCVVVWIRFYSAGLEFYSDVVVCTSFTLFQAVVELCSGIVVSLSMVDSRL